MPDLTFHPEYDRHLTFAALSHCPRDYRLVREIADGTRPAQPAGESLLVGIGADKLIGELWRQTQRGEGWNPGEAQGRAHELLEETEHQNPRWIDGQAAIVTELSFLARDYVEQWRGVRAWQVLHVDPADDEAQIPRLVVPLNSDRGYLTMPDLEARIGGVLTIVDRKTGKWPYNPAHWAYEPQMLTYCLAAEAHYQEPVQFQIDYMQRPRRDKKGNLYGTPSWTCALTYPFPFDDERRKLAKSWLAELEERHDTHMLHAIAVENRTYISLIEPWPRDPARCHTAAGSGKVRCPWEGVCFGSPDET